MKALIGSGPLSLAGLAAKRGASRSATLDCMVHGRRFTGELRRALIGLQKAGFVVVDGTGHRIRYRLNESSGAVQLLRLTYEAAGTA